MSERGQSDAGDDNFQPPSPYDEPTGSFRVPEISEADRDAFYERHRRRPGQVSRVESLDDIGPDEVETRPLQVPPSAKRRNPVPMPPVTPVDPPTSRTGDGPSAADTAPTAKIGTAPKSATPTGQPKAPSAEDRAPSAEEGAGASSAQGVPAAAAATENTTTAKTAAQETEKIDAEATTRQPPTPIPSVEETFPELAKTRREDAQSDGPAPTRALTDEDFDTSDDGDSRTAAMPAPAALAAYDSDEPHEQSDQPDHDGDREPVTVAAVREPRGTLDLGLLVLRLGLGVAAVAHGLQHLFGWWGGPGISGYQDFLANDADPALGFHPDAVHILAIAGGVTEVVGGALIILGLFTPIGACAILSVMLLATTFRVTLAGGFSYFASAGGVEYEILLAVAAAALILTGPGLYSLDRPRKWARRPFIGSVVWLALAIAAAVVVWIFLNGANPLESPGNPG
ncbi:DoxX family membrane protein [Gordonia sp. NPDC003950]